LGIGSGGLARSVVLLGCCGGALASRGASEHAASNPQPSKAASKIPGCSRGSNRRLASDITAPSPLYVVGSALPEILRELAAYGNKLYATGL
jgi:hypothetical protein